MIARVQISKHLYTLPHVIVSIPTVIGNVEVFVWKTCEWKIFIQNDKDKFIENSCISTWCS